MAAAGGAQTRDEQSRPSLSGLCLFACAFTPRPLIKRIVSIIIQRKAGNGSLSLSVFSLYWNRWTSLGLLWRVAPAVDPTHMHDRCGSCLLLDRPVWNPIPEAGSVAFAVISSFFLSWQHKCSTMQIIAKAFIYSFTSICIIIILYYISIIYLYSLPDVLIHSSCLLIYILYLYILFQAAKICCSAAKICPQRALEL